MDRSKIIFTGKDGLLGGEMMRQAPDLCYTNRESFDITDYGRMRSFVEAGDFEAVVHAAAFTSPPVCEKEPLPALENNIVGTANIVRLCIEFGLKLIYISTDYVYRGDRGNYSEEDEVGPVNKYAWSKLGGECAVRLYDNSLIIRTSFGPKDFPYPKAFVDQWTSRLSVAEAAARILALLETDALGVVNVGGPRRTVAEYARSLDPSRDIGELSIGDVDFPVPADTSLNTAKLERIIRSTKA